MRARTAIVVLFVLSFAVLIPPGTTGATDVGGVASIDRIEAWQASANEPQFQDATDVRAAIEDGRLSRATGVNASHQLVVELELHGFEGAVNEANGSTTTERFKAAFRDHGRLVIRQTNMGPQRLPLLVDMLNETSVMVYSDATNETYYLAIDLATATGYRDGSPEELREGWDYEFEVRAELAADSSLTVDKQIARTVITSREVSVDTAPDGRVHLRPLPNQVVTGTTNLGTGTSVNVVLAGETNPETDTNESFRLTREVPVELVDEGFRYEGRFDATFDMTNISPAATNVTVDVRLAHRSMLTRPIPARVNDFSAAIDAYQVVQGGGSDGVTVTGTLSAGGFLVLHEATADGLVVGHSPYVEPGEENVTVYVNQPVDTDELAVVAHRDANHNEWFDGPTTDSSYTGPEATDVIVIDEKLPGGDESTESTTTPAGFTLTAMETSPATSPALGGGSPESRTTGTGPPEDSGLNGGVLTAIGVVIIALLLMVFVRGRS